MKHKKTNILVNNKAEFKQSLAHYFKHETEPRDETHAGLKILFEIEPSDVEYSNFDHNCRTKIVAKIVDDVTFQKFWKNACIWNETFTFKRVDTETKEQFDEFIKMEGKLDDILSKEFQITKSIQELIELMDEESLKFAENEPNFWKGAIGHIKRKISLYVDTIPTFDLLESDVVEEDENEAISNIFETTKTALSSIEDKFVQPKPLLMPNVTKEKWLHAMDHLKSQYQRQYEETKKEYPELNIKLQEIFIDEEVISLVKGFMVGPVGVFCNNLIEGNIVQKYDNLPELKIFLNLQAKTKDIVLYMTFKEDGKYFFRGNFVDNYSNL